MHMRTYEIKKKDFYSITFGLLLLMALCVCSLNMQNDSKPRIFIIIAAITSVFFAIRSLSEVNNRYILFCFNLTYFLFLISGLLVNSYSYSVMKAYLAVSDEALVHTCFCIAISIIIINIVYFVLKSPVDCQENEQITNNYTGGKTLNQIIKILFYVSIVGKFVESFLIYSLSSSMGYSESYTISVNLPFYFSAPSAAFYLLFCLWLSTKPSKREFIFPIIIVLIMESLILFSGDRSEPMSVILMLSYYVIVQRKNDEFYNINKKQIILIAAAAIGFIYLLQYVSFSRDHNAMTITENFIIDFFNKQGISAAVIGKGYDLKDSIAEIGGHHFTIGAILNYLTQNVVARTLFGINRIKLNSVEAATSGNSYGSTMAYIRFRSSYLNGVGCGTSYIAELYHDGGMMLLILGSALAAILMYYVYVKIINNAHKTFITEALALLLFKNMITLPRNGCFTWLTSTFSVQNLLILFVIIVIQKALLKRE